MLALSLAASVAFAPMGGHVAAPNAARAVMPSMAANRKFVAFDEDTIFEAREISVNRKPYATAPSFPPAAVQRLPPRARRARS